MKPQDILFLIVFLLALYKRNPKLCVILGIACLGMSIPFFSFWVFFTAQRLVYYAFFFLLLGCLLFLLKKR